MRRILSCTVAVLLCIPSLAQTDPVVMTVNGYDVTKSEFEYFFEKNNIETNVTKKTVRQYADLYLNFKLKVQSLTMTFWRKWPATHMRSLWLR